MSSTPRPYNRQARFAGFQTPEFPTTGQDLDAEFNAVDVSLDQTQARLAEIQRDDGALRNESVHPDALNRTVRAILAARNGLVRGAWGAGQQYAVGDVVGFNNNTYLAASAHVSTDFNLQLAAGNWLLITGFVNSFAGNGSNDHGQLAGLLDDDHPQYLNQARGDLRYVQTSNLQSIISNINASSANIPIVTIANTSATIDATFKSALIICTSAAPVTLTIRQNTGNATLDWQNGDYFSVRAAGAGAVTVSGPTIDRPAGLAVRTRVQGSTISLVAEDVSVNRWSAMNDLAPAP